MSRLKLPFVPAADRDTFTGTDREITFDPVNTKLVIHDGVTPGGFPLLTEEDKTNTTKAELTKTFTSGEEVVLSLENDITTAPVVSVIKEVPQLNQTNNDWDVASDGANYTLHDTAYSTTLTPSDANADGTFTLGTGSFAAEDVGKRIEGNGGVAYLKATDGSYSLDTAFNDTSTISAGDWSMFALQAQSSTNGFSVSNYVVDAPYDLSFAQDTNNTITQPSGEINALFIKPDGTKLFALSTFPFFLSEYDLSTPYDLSTASFSKDSSSELDPDGIRLTDFYITESGDKMIASITNIGTSSPFGSGIAEYQLNIPWDVNSISFSNEYDLGSDEIQSVHFDENQGKLYLVGGNTESVKEYNYTFGSTPSNTGNSFTVTSANNAPYGLFIDESGTILMLADVNDDEVYEYTLSTPFDASTGSYTGNTLGDSFSSSDMYGLHFSKNGTKMYLGFTSSGEIKEYSLVQPSFVSPQNSTAITNVGGQINTEFWANINSMTADDASNDGSVFYAVSTDNRTTWKVIDDAEGAERAIVRNNAGTWEYNDASVYASETWVAASENDEFYALEEAVTVTVNRMDTTQLNAVSDANHYTLGDDLDLAITMFMPDSGSTSPTSDGVSINYDAQVKNSGAILGTDYEWDRPAADTVKFKALSNENFKIRVV